jgi:hypothetical protein
VTLVAGGDRIRWEKRDALGGVHNATKPSAMLSDPTMTPTADSFHDRHVDRKSMPQLG